MVGVPRAAAARRVVAARQIAMVLYVTASSVCVYIYNYVIKITFTQVGVGCVGCAGVALAGVCACAHVRMAADLPPAASSCSANIGFVRKR